VKHAKRLAPVPKAIEDVQGRERDDQEPERYQAKGEGPNGREIWRTVIVLDKSPTTVRYAEAADEDREGEVPRAMWDAEIAAGRLVRVLDDVIARSRQKTAPRFNVGDRVEDASDVQPPSPPGVVAAVRESDGFVVVEHDDGEKTPYTNPGWWRLVQVPKAIEDVIRQWYGVEPDQADAIVVEWTADRLAASRGAERAAAEWWRLNRERERLGQRTTAPPRGHALHDAYFALFDAPVPATPAPEYAPREIGRSGAPMDLDEYAWQVKRVLRDLGAPGARVEALVTHEHGGMLPAAHAAGRRASETAKTIWKIEREVQKEAKDPVGLDEATDAYVDAALATSTDEDDRHLDRDYDRGDVSDEAAERARADVRDFLLENADDVGDMYADAGRDFWLTRSGHSAGFWGDWPEPAATRLTDAAHRRGEATLYVGDDGKLYLP
jgi:hypothetical protein